MLITDALQKECIVFLHSVSQDEVLHELIEILESTGKIRDRKTFTQAIFAREKLVSTAIGLGVAIPHAKLEGYENFFMALGIQKTTGIPWKALDNQPVRFVFLIGGPEGKQTEYLSLLSQITACMKDETRKKKLLHTYSTSEILQLLS